MERAIAKLGEGIYTAADAARVLNIPYRKAKYWFSYYAKQGFSNSSDFVYHFHIKDIVAVNFLTLIEMNVFYALKEKKVTTRTILNLHCFLADFLKTPYPFAKEDFYVKDRRTVLLERGGNLLTADASLQLVMGQVATPAYPKIVFNNKRLATKYYPLGQNKSVVADPQHQFGQPIIEGTNILTATIYDLHLGNEKNDFIAELYGIKVKDVQDAIEFSRLAA